MEHIELNNACVLKASTGFTSKSTQMLCSHHCRTAQLDHALKSFHIASVSYIVPTEATEQRGVNDGERECGSIKNKHAKKYACPHNILIPVIYGLLNLAFTKRCYYDGLGRAAYLRIQPAFIVLLRG